MGYSFLWITITGIVLYIAPPGRIAHWSEWTFLGFTKEEWQALHTLFSFIGTVAAVYHIIFNWKPLLNYMRRKAKEGMKVRREFVYATIATALVFAGTYYDIPPFGSVMDLGEYVTNSWADETNEPPIPHAELLTLGEFSRTIKMPLNEIVKTLKRNGFAVSDTSVIIADLAKTNNTTPNRIYLLLKVDKKLREPSGAGSKYVPGSGFGRKKLSEILEENGMKWDEGVKMLSEKGIEVTEDKALKEIAEDNDVTPFDVVRSLGLK